MKLIAPIAVMIAAASAGRVFDNNMPATLTSSADNYQPVQENQQRRQYSMQSDGYVKQHLQNYREDSGEKHANILGFHSENNGHNYKYGYETENGIKAEEVGETTGHGTSAQGAYSYKGDDGKIYTVSYIADEHGFRPSGEHLPTPPPVPEEILKSLEFNAHEEANGVFDDGNYHEKKEEGHEHHQLEAGQEYQAPQHYESAQQSVASGADLAYHAHTPTYHTINQASSEGSTGYAQSNVVYYQPRYTGHSTGHGVVNTGYSQQIYEGNLHANFLPVVENSGHSYSASSDHAGDRTYLPPSSHY